jgi:hypothetical protein
LTGCHPFRAAGAPSRRAIPPRGAAITPPSGIRPHLPHALDRAVLGALEWDMAKRTDSVDAFRAALTDCSRWAAPPRAAG